MSDFQAEVLLEIPNMVIAKGRPFLLLRAEDGAFALGQMVGGQVNLKSEWVTEQKILDVALRVLAGDQAAVTHPRALLHVSLAFFGVFAVAKKREAEKAAP